MDLEPQSVINALFAVVGFLGGWILNSIRRSIDRLRRDHSDQAIRIQEVELLVRGDYVRRDELDRFSVRLFQKLDRIEDKMDGKADK